jgi:hypothetical protein
MESSGGRYEPEENKLRIKMIDKLGYFGKAHGAEGIAFKFSELATLCAKRYALCD